MRLQYRDRGVWSRHITRSRDFGAYTKAPYRYGIWNMEQELEATYWNGAKNLISTTVYSIACKFDALTDMEELQIQKSSDLLNNTLIFGFELHFGYNMELPLHRRKRWPILTHGPKTPKALLYSLILCYLPTKPNTFVQSLCILNKLLINLLLIYILSKNLLKLR